MGRSDLGTRQVKQGKDENSVFKIDTLRDMRSVSVKIFADGLTDALETESKFPSQNRAI